jgi:triacylglycerol lipase
MNDQLGVAEGGGNQGEDLAMTLASITYCADIADSLKQYAPGWTLAWLPDAAVNGNYAYIARSRAGSQYVVAIRGSLLNFSWAAFDNWFEQDFNVFEQVDWQYPADPQGKPKISRGSSDGLDDLTSLVQTNPAGQTTMLDYLLANAVGKDQSIAVVGHSLGGNLATVYAPWLLYQLRQRNRPAPSLFPVFTFAAPPAGNTAFAQAFDKAFPASWRYYNVYDIVPKASVLLSMLSMCELYSPSPLAYDIDLGDGVTLCDAIGGIALAISTSELYYESFYSQTNLTGGGEPLTPGDTCCQTKETDPLLAWFDKAGCNHGHNTYLSLLKADPVNCKQTAPTP